MPLSESYIVEKLIPALDSLRDGARAIERRQSIAIGAAPASHRDSARNLLHYLALRQRDISELQRDLAVLGLSRLGRAEANVMASLEAVSYALHRLAGCAPPARETTSNGRMCWRRSASFRTFRRATARNALSAS
ncbi:MAG: hypothetical protein RBS80_04245 [Thermoguttaceae bacterium]|jgi:pyruvate kinase|nr:hypothetical protein [Thermoguttaceae bacterium]